MVSRRTGGGLRPRAEWKANQKKNGVTKHKAAAVLRAIAAAETLRGA